MWKFTSKAGMCMQVVLCVGTTCCAFVHVGDAMKPTLQMLCSKFIEHLVANGFLQIMHVRIEHFHV